MGQEMKFSKRNVFMTTVFLLVSSHCLFGTNPNPGKHTARQRKAPFHVLFSNDFTNIETCVSPYHKKGEPFKPQMLEATVDETAGTGIEVHMLQPCTTWVPWWQSKVYSMQEHYKWWKEKYGNEPKMPVHEYIIKGGDPFKVFIKRCRQHSLSPFISVRLNDGHHLEYVDTPNNTKGMHCICRFYAENPGYRIGPDKNNWYQRVQNWAIPEVRAYKFALIKEICESYDIDGLELDYMRHVNYFQLDKTTSEQRAAIMTEFIGRVRDVLDSTAKDGQRRWLCVRVPCYLEAHDALGIDLQAMVKAGVDMVNASTYYFTEQQTDLAKIVKLLPGTAVYIEMCHTTMVGKNIAKGYDAFTFRRTTDEQYYTTAHLAYSRGAAGVSAFNFVYYREHGKGERGPFSEPPFHIFEHLGDPEWLARQNQHYILAKVWNNPPVPNRQMPKKVNEGQTVKFELDMAPPAGGWKMDGKLRVQSENLLGKSKWTARFNGVELKATDDLAESYPNPYPPLLGTKETLRAWIVPKKLLEDGYNNIEIILVEGKPADIIFLDLAVK